ncbi:unnamed protein product, partial [marine sediment metagenome]
MTEHSYQNKDLQDQATAKEAVGALDAAGRSLFEALRVSF